MNTFRVNPRLINLNNRFDVMLKYMLVKSVDTDLQTSFYEDAYRNHLEVWNGCVEYDNPEKNSYQKFRDSFANIIESIKRDGYSDSAPAIPAFGNNILNGAHRVAACLYHSKEIVCRESNNPNDGQLDCSWYFFRNLQRDGKVIDPWYADQAAIEYVDMFDDTKMICVFPSAIRQGGVDDLRNALRSAFGVFYEKSVHLNELGRINLMKDLYYREAWAEANGGAGYHDKASLCFGNDDGTPAIFFIVRMGQAQAVDCKEKIRNVYKVGKHSVHINDTWQETKRIARAIFNSNSVHFLNHARPTAQFKSYLAEFEKSLGMDHENYCITASMVMAAYGLREAKDVDYLYRKFPISTSNSLISTHNQYLDVHYKDHVDNLIMNPRNYFYCHGVKLISIDALKRMKTLRDEEKDRVDIRMIEDHLSSR